MPKVKEYQLTLATRRKLISLIAPKDKEFIRYLKEMRILHVFFRNIKKSTPCDQIPYTIPLEWLRKEYINWGLVWRYTPEGQQFWEDYNNQWKTNNTPKTTNKEYLKQAEYLLAQILKIENENKSIYNQS